MGNKRPKVKTQEMTKEQERELKLSKLTGFAALFCLKFEEYSKDTATASNEVENKARRDCAKVFGISEREARRYIKTPVVAAHIKASLEKAAAKYQRKADDVLAEAAFIAFSDVGEFFEDDGKGGLRLKNIFQMGPMRRAIKKIKHSQKITRIPGNDPDAPPTEVIENEYEYELWAKDAMLKMLAQYHRLINRTQESGEGALPPAEDGGAVIILPDNGSGGKITIEYEGKKQAPKEIEYQEIDG